MEEVSPQPNRTTPQRSEESSIQRALRQESMRDRLKQWQELETTPGLSANLLVNKKIDEIFDVTQEMEIAEINIETKKIAYGDDMVLVSGVGQFNLATALEVCKDLIEECKTTKVIVDTSYFLPLTTLTQSTGKGDQPERAWFVIKKKSSFNIELSLVVESASRVCIDHDFPNYIVEEK